MSYRVMKDPGLSKELCYQLYRKRWKGDVFGSSEEDDVDVLFSIYSKYLVYRTEGDLLCNA